MEDTASHETAYKLAHRVDKANFSSKSAHQFWHLCNLPNCTKTHFV
jgi:hypothetical protein